MSPVLRQPSPPIEPRRMGNIMLNGATITARAHASPGQQHMAQVVILDGAAIPTPEHFKIWAATLAGHGFTRMRTGALAPRQAAQAERAGLTCVQELSLLDMATPASAPRPMHRTSRLQPSRFDTIAAIDLAAFGANWTLDAAMLADVRSATPSHRARVVALHGAIVGFLISGRANRTGYIQRLAVLPDRQRQGIAAALLVDSLRWMRRSRTQRVYVNTHIENHAALELYRRHGFNELPDRLRVFEGSVTA